MILRYAVLLAIFSVAAMSALEQPAKVSKATAAVEFASLTKASSSSIPSLSADEVARQLARRAYVWGWPMVYVQNARESLRKVSKPGRSGGMPVAPINQLSMLTDYITPTQTAVPCPNQDVVYGFGVFDLAEEPVVVQVPDFGSRFWLYQLGDQRTDSFARCGKAYGTPAGCYLVVGPNWNEKAPAGIAGVFRSPTTTAYCLPRVFMDDTAEDRVAVQSLLNGIMAYPLSRFAGGAKTTDWTKSKWYPKVGVAGGDRAKRVSPERFFDDLATVLDDVAPLAGEEAFYAELRDLLKRAAGDARLKSLITSEAVVAEREVLAPMFEFRNLGTRLPNYWTTITNGAAFGTDYLTRAAVAKSNIFVNRNEETKYFYQDCDAAGLRLDGGRSYRITFRAGELPPTAGFWSLTAYDAQHAFGPNELNRYSLGTKNRGLRFNADGSLTIVVQSRRPTGDDANWLPAPQGAFSLYLRAYAPGAAMTSGVWTPPAVIATSGDLQQLASR